MSVIGDGGVSEWRILVGALYMILSGVVLVTAFSSSIGVAPNPVDHLQDIGIKWLDGKAPADQLLYQRIRNVKFVKITIIVTEFAALNLLGMFAARFFVNASEVEAEQWSWMTTFYWSVQTTTTIGVSVHRTTPLVR